MLSYMRLRQASEQYRQPKVVAPRLSFRRSLYNVLNSLVAKIPYGLNAHRSQGQNRSTHTDNPTLSKLTGRYALRPTQLWLIYREKCLLVDLILCFEVEAVWRPNGWKLNFLPGSFLIELLTTDILAYWSLKSVKNCGRGCAAKLRAKIRIYSISYPPC